MNAVVLLLAGAMVGAPPEPAISMNIRPSKGQELVYRGTYTEESSRPGARFTRRYDLESYILILDALPRETRAAFLTVHRLQGEKTVVTGAQVRLEIGKMDPFGRLTFPKRTAAPPSVPLNGPPTLETAAFVELPKDGLDAGKTWQTTAGSDPAMRWSVTGLESVGCRCVKLLGEQRAANWGQIGQPSWRREDRIWLQLHSGFASRIERTIQHRDESGEIIWRSQMTAELDNSYNPVFHPGGTFKVRQTTVERTVELAKVLDDLLQLDGPPDIRGYENLLSRIDFTLKNVTDTPYREALVALRRQALAGQSGERAPPAAAVEIRKDPIRPLEVGQALPNAMIADAAGRERLSLLDVRGKAAMLIFVKGSSPTIDHVLRYIADAQTRYADSTRVVPLIVDGEPAVRARCAHLKFDTRFYIGSELHRSIAGETTPLTVIADKTGTVRVIAAGWGGEYPEWFHREIQKILQQ